MRHSHLLAVIEHLEASGARFRSLRDPIDTTTPQGMFSLQVLGAVAQLERALIAERTKCGLRAARARRWQYRPARRVTRTPSARCVLVATSLTWTASWRGWTPGYRLCGARARLGRRRAGSEPRT